METHSLTRRIFPKQDLIDILTACLHLRNENMIEESEFTLTKKEKHLIEYDVHYKIPMLLRAFMSIQDITAIETIEIDPDLKFFRISTIMSKEKPPFINSVTTYRAEGSDVAVDVVLEYQIFATKLPAFISNQIRNFSEKKADSLRDLESSVFG